MSIAKKYLSTTFFSLLSNWDVKLLLGLKYEFSDKIPLVLFGDFLSKANIKRIEIEDNETYQILGVKSYGKGAYINRIVEGKTLKMRIYQQSDSNSLFWCKVDTKNGAFGIIDKGLSKGVASTNMTFAKIDVNKALPNYIQLLFCSPKVNSYMDNFVTGTTNRKYIKPNQLLSEIFIPLPSLEEQNKIVVAYNKKIQLAEQQEQQVTELEAEIENYLYQELGIEKQEKKEKKKGLQLIKFSTLDIWGIRQNTSVLESNIYENVTLTNIAYINPQTDLKDLPTDLEMSFIPMGCISDLYGEIIEKRKGKKELSKGYTKFQEEDLIWARITPCMQNGKSAVARNLTNGLGYGSTEYHVIRKKSPQVSIDYLYSLLRLKSVLSNAQNFFTGSAGQQRVPKSYLENLEIPLPPLSIQNEIVEHITDLKEQIKTLRQQAEINRKQAIADFENTIFS